MGFDEGMPRPKRLTRAAVLLAVGGALAGLPWACGLDVLGTGPALDSDAASAGDGTVGRDRVEGDSVGPVEGSVDGGVDGPADAVADTSVAMAACLAACTNGTCVGGICTINCTAAADCPDNPCPAGVPCDVTCTGSNACGNAIDCTNCNVRCIGTNACGNSVKCTGPGCTIRCCGAGACNNNVECNGSGCRVACGPSSACNGNADCNGGTCADAGLLCD